MNDKNLTDKSTLENFIFPRNFLWGTSISSTQTEGNNINDWADVVAKDGNKVGKACDHYNRYKEDFVLAASMNNNCIRVGIEWSRLQKSAYGHLDTKEVEHYRKYLGEAKDLGLEPMVVLHHFANPCWFSSKSGWKNTESSDVFADYTKKTIKEFKDLVKMWNTFNEPNFYLLNAYFAGIFPPFNKNILNLHVAKRNIEIAHQRSYRLAKEISNNLVAVTAAWRPCWGDNKLDNLIAKTASYFMNTWFYENLMKDSDFFGLSYYGHTFISNCKPLSPLYGAKKEEIEKKGLKCDDFNLLTPERLMPTLKDVSEKYRKPIIIVENGFATTDEELRKDMLIEHIRQVGRALKSGIDIKGYIYWSLMDNFEWDHGYTKNFGLCGVDWASLERKKRPATDAYAEICKTNSIITL